MLVVARMKPLQTLVAVIYTFTSLYSVQASQVEKRSRSLWYRERVFHEGSGLNDGQLHSLVSLTDNKHFSRVLEPLLVPRVVGTENHAKVRQHIVSTMESLGWTVEEDSFEDKTPFGVKTFTNTIATLNPAATRLLVLACHYDSKYFREGTFIGATDSAVPCAMLLNLAYALRKQLHLHKRSQDELTLQFIFFDGEEAFRQWSPTDSLYGARNMASKWHQTAFPENNTENTNLLHRIDLFILLDLLGTKDVKFYSYYPETDSWYTRLVSFEKRLKDLDLLHNLPIMFIDKTWHNPGIEDDHTPFLKKGVPVLHIIPIPFPSVWHKHTDNKEALHKPTIQNLAVIIRAFVVDYLHLAV